MAEFQLISGDLAVQQDVRRFQRVPMFQDTTVRVPPLRFSDISFAPTTEQSHDAILQGWSVPVGPVDKMVIRDAILCYKYGFISVNNLIIKESLWHAPYHALPNVQSLPDNKIEIPIASISGKFDKAFHLGVCGASNYYHWMIDGVARLSADASLLNAYRFVVLASEMSLPFQLESMRLTCDNNFIFCQLCGDAAVSVEELHFLSPRVHLHPAQYRIFDKMRELAVDKVNTERRSPWRRLYISRADSRSRRLLNEELIMDLVEGAGFECVALAGMSILDQIALFAEASHIIGPHGAGMANLVFCNPGTKICEFHMSTHVNWRIRYLAACRNLKYGCIFGPTDEPAQPSPHADTWTIPASTIVELVKKSSAFLDA
jgi:hypothetical protein